LKKKVSYIYLITANLLVLFSILLISEFAIRLTSSIQTCFKDKCDFKSITKLNISTEKDIGLYVFDEKVGYLHKKNFKYIFPDTNRLISIDEKGFRNNKKKIGSSELDILAIGCSFTFGDQVSDFETWPSYLQEKLNIRVDNAGVQSYGTAQAVLLGQEILKKKYYNTVILSTLVGKDFARDQMVYKSGFPQPSFVKIKDQISIHYPPKNFQLGSKFNPHKEGLKYFLNDYFKLYNYFASRILGNQNRGLLDKFNPNAAEIEDIIEWTFKSFDRMNVKNKFLLLQYPHNKNDKNTMKEREILINKAKKLNFIVIDTLNYLKKIDANLLWDGHHTARGNNLISDIIIKTNKEIFYKK